MLRNIQQKTELKSHNLTGSSTSYIHISTTKAFTMSTDIDEKESPWYQTWFALTYDRMEAEMNLFRETQSALQDEWEEESKKYEEEITVKVKDLMENDLTITVPRRNYFNASGTVNDVTLFPYHKAFYPLLDAYDSLNVNIHHYSLLSLNASRPFPLRFSQNRMSFMDIDADDSPLFLPCSNEATSWTLGCHPGPPGRNIDEFRPMFWYGLECILLDHRHSFPPYYRDIIGEEKYFKVVVEKMIFPSDDASYSATARKWYTTGPYGPVALPGDRAEQIALLLKILRHSLSEIQRDYRLASCVLLLMIRLRYPGDVDVFRKMLAIIDSEYCHPTGSNERDFCEFHRAISFHIIHTGIIRYTPELDHCLSAFVRATFLREFPTLLPDDKKEESVIGKRKKLLVRAVVARQAEEYDERDVRNNDDAGKIPILFIETLIRSLGCRGHLERVNQFDHLDTSTPEDYPERKGFFRKSLESYENIVRSLVSIANSVIQILPEGERYYGIASELVLSLCRCMRKEEYFATFWGGIDEYHHYKTFGYISTDKYGKGGEVRLEPLRYVHGITNSTAIMTAKRLHRDQYKLQPSDSMGFMRDAFVEVFHCKPKQDVLDAVRGLFLRNLVDIRVSAVGYGDFLVLCDYEITPLDPMLDWTEYAYPDEEGSDDDDDDNEDESLDEGDRLANWVKDEAGAMLTYNDLCARNDLQLVLLQRAWQAPWTPETHASFQPSFRVAVATIAKSIHRLGFPHEIMLSICSFLHRDWWDDRRKQCWNYACLSEKSSKAISRKMAHGYSAASIDDHQDSYAHLEYCRRCHVAMYCSKNCKSRDSYLGHKARCCPAMSKPPRPDELQLYTKILSGEDGKSTLPVFLNSYVHLSNNRAVENVCKDNTTTGDTGDGVNIEEDDGDDDANDEDASWETMDSDEDEEKEAGADESKMSITQLVRKYFDHK